jgi:peptidoglycan biosynthesis protein MviN/MurJ (putative lipid II flippase)
MFPLDRFAIVDGSVTRIGAMGFRPLPDTLRLMQDGPPRLGVVGLALGAALSSWVEYRLLKGALQWRIGPMPPMGHGARWCLIAAIGCGILAAGLRSRTDDLPQIVAAAAVCVPTLAVYLLITTVMRVPEATFLVGRLRRVVAGRLARQR